jgi:hypothetical protein
MIRIYLHCWEEGEMFRRTPAPRSTIGGPLALTTDELNRWLDDHREAIADRWLAEIRSRSEGMDEEELALVGEFLHLITAFLAPGLGGYREIVEHLFQEAATLFGNLGAFRGGAVGETVEEFQLLREVVLRTLYVHPPGETPSFPGLRDFLQLNRLIDLGVVYTSVGHADSLFFNLLHRTGVLDTSRSDFFERVRDQIGGIREELEGLVLQSVENGQIVTTKHL